MEGAVRRIALLIEYDGTAYGGSQYQKNAPTIQGSLERAISSLTGEQFRVALAGRTDAGVHARGQVASFTTASRHPPAVFVKGLNHYLPEDISVNAAAEVPAGFDPRRQARRRWYRYTIHNAHQRPALRRRYAWHVPQPLRLPEMQAAAAALVGRHDFAAFCQPSALGGRRTERLVERSQLSPCGRRLWFDIEADVFLPQMVRRLVGALVDVGRGRLAPQAFEALLGEARPGAARFVAPPHGLCLMKVRFDDGLFDEETDEDLQS